MPPPHADNMRVLLVILLVFWLATSSNDGQSGYFGAPFLTQERLMRQRYAFGILNSTAWGDFNPRLVTDPLNGTEATRYLNLTGFRQADGFSWGDLARFRERCLEWSRDTRPLLPVDGEGEGQHQMKSAWDIGLVGAVWQNATGIVKGPWVRRNASENRTWSAYNLTAITPSLAWSGTHGEWYRNVTGSEGKMQLRVEDKRRTVEYDDAGLVPGADRLSTGGFVREVAATLNLDDAVSPDGSGSNYEMRLHGVHWPRQGNMLLTTTSEKFAGIFGLPHLAPHQTFFASSQKLLNQTIDEVLRKKEKSAFTDQSNPWASSAEDAWNPSPHCEYVVYLQVHPLHQDGLPSKDAQGAPLDGARDLVKELEDELRYPTGAPIRYVPELQMSAIMYSPDCAYFLETKGPPHFSELSGNTHLTGFKEEIWIWDVNLCVLAMAAIVLGQVYLLKSQMRESYTPSTMGRISFWTLIMMVLADGMMFALSAVLALDSAHFYLRALILTFALFMSMMIGGSFLGEIYRVQESEWRRRERENAPNNGTPRPSSNPSPPMAETLPRPVTASVATNQQDTPIIIPSDQDVDAEIAENVAAGAAAVPNLGTASPQQVRVMPFSTIVARLIVFGSFICFLSLASMSWWKPLRNAFINATLFAYLSFWIPQIWRNIQRNSRRAFSWPFMVGQSVLRITPVAYFYLYPDNMVFSESDWTSFLVLAGWLWLQLWIFFFQDVLGPRFGMPKGWMPEAWDYHPILREDNLESGGLPVGLVPSSSTPTSPILERMRSLSLSSGEADRAVREKGTSSHTALTNGNSHGIRIRAIDCAICCEVLEVPVVKAGEEAEPAGGGVAGVLERRKYMVTPCRHIFHSPCLEGWLRFRLQCPICREELPPLYRGQSFVVKRVSNSFFHLSRELKRDFAVSHLLRMHVDYNEEERTLVYEYFRHTFLALLRDYPGFPLAEVKKILRHTGEAVKELHAKDWIHIDVKPDNILVDWTYDEQGNHKVDKVALGDFDLALKLINEQPLRAPYAVGNAMWRSPEGQSGKGVAKPSDVYSFGLVCIFGLGGGPMLILDDETIRSLKENVLPVETEAVLRHFIYFGPLPEELLKHVNDDTWDTIYKSASEIADTEAAGDPDARFERWSSDIVPHLTPGAKEMISKMTYLGPGRRATIDEVMALGEFMVVDGSRHQLLMAWVEISLAQKRTAKEEQPPT